MKRLAIVAALVACGMAAQAQTAPEPSLDAVMKKGVLRACTPGDYKPFSFLRADGAYEGIDIDLANSLATAGAKLEVVKTWANLTSHRPNATSRSAASRSAFSTGYMVNGKTPIARCEDVAKAWPIDKPGVRVIANPGGSNERAKANFKTRR